MLLFDDMRCLAAMLHRHCILELCAQAIWPLVSTLLPSDDMAPLSPLLCIILALISSIPGLSAGFVRISSLVVVMLVRPQMRDQFHSF